VSASYDGERKWSVLCLLGLHRWKLRNGDGQARYRACQRCNLVDDAWIGAIGF
jgi:hypothetical protein